MKAFGEGLEWHPALLLRAPFYSLEAYDPARLGEYLAGQEFRNALWLASPGFYGALEKKQFDEKLLDPKERFTLLKYLNRMCFRCTPFGAFASFGLAGWSEEGQTCLAGTANSRLHLHPSREWQLSRETYLQNTQADCKLRTNPTLYRVGEQYRFIGSQTTASGKLEFEVRALADEKINRQLTSRAKKVARHRLEMVDFLVGETGCTSAEAAAYLGFLIGEQVLLPDYLVPLIANGQEGEPLPGFWEAHRSQPPGSSLSLPGLAAGLARQSAALGLSPVRESFYAGLERGVEKGGISCRARDQLGDAVLALTRLVAPYPHPALEEFKTAFRRKFDFQQVPLLTALDPDTGINYGGLQTGFKDKGLLQGLSFSEKDGARQQLDWTPVHRLLLRIWQQDTERAPYSPVRIKDADLKELDGTPGPYRFPPSVAVMFYSSVAGVVIESAGGGSATALTGRFSLFSKDVHGFNQAVATAESRANPGVLLAEVHQRSHTHVDNINRRKRIYEGVIPVNCYPGDQGLSVSPGDLGLSLAGDELVLFSRRLQKRIVPRLPTAYNFHHNDLAVFQFLCDLQFQGLQANLNFDPEKLFPGLPFYPRVLYREVILSPARWTITEAEVKRLTAPPLSLGRLHLFRQERGVPQRVSLGLSDQQLVFDLANDQEAFFFLDYLKEVSHPKIREYLLPDRSVTAGKNAFAGQAVAVLLNQHEVYPAPRPVSGRRKKALQRKFLPGSEWLYLKVYCTVEMADVLLLSLWKPLLQQHRRLMESWFFIRYQDPEHHLRIRIKSRPQDMPVLLQLLERRLRDKKHAELLRDVKSDTYEREVERYSPELIGPVEDFFCAGSAWVLQAIDLQPVPALFPEAPAFVMVCRMAACFMPGPAALQDFFGRRAGDFLKEFGGTKKLKMEMDRKHREIGQPLSALLDGEQDPRIAAPDLEPLLERLRPLVSASGTWPAERRAALLADLVHMQVNRYFRVAQRQHEALIYYCLFKYARSVRARQKANPPGPGS